MHEGEYFFALGWRDAAGLVYISLVWLILVWNKRAPSAESFRSYVTIIDSRGGLIAILACGSVWTFSSAMRLFYHYTDLIAQNKIDEKSAIVMMAIQFATGSAFGGCFGAMLALMKGGENGPRPAVQVEVPQNETGAGTHVTVDSGAKKTEAKQP